jgi:hypothetical protein
MSESNKKYMIGGIGILILCVFLSCISISLSSSLFAFLGKSDDKENNNPLSTKKDSPPSTKKDSPPSTKKDNPLSNLLSPVTPRPSSNLLKPVIAPSSWSPMANGCEANPPLLSCPSGKTIKSGELSYGRWDNNVCPHETINSGTGYVRNKHQINSRCINQQQCQINSLNDEFGDPMPGVYKQWESNIVCG